MKLAFAIQRKLRLAIMLAVMMLFVIIFSLIETYNITRISKSINSIYEDRLIPAVDLYSMADHIHNKRHQLFTFLYTEDLTSDQIRTYLKETNNSLAKLISKYETTHLVKDESNHLIQLKKNLDNFKHTELMLVEAAEHNKETARKMYASSVTNYYEQLNANLIQLTRVQTRVGKELLAESNNSKSSSTLISQLQVAITIILGLIIMILIITNKQVLLKQEKYNLN